jgi:signal transduction histidine kinase
MTRRLVLSYLGITVFVLLVLEIPLGVTFAGRSKENLLADIERDARVFATQVDDRLETGAGFDPQPDIARYAASTGGRVVVVDTQGIAVIDSDEQFGAGRDFSTRPEIREAVEGHMASGSRLSGTLQQELLYVAVPVASSGRVLGAVRITYPRSKLDARVHTYWLRLALLAATVVTAATLVGWLLARSVSRPLRELQVASTRIAAGDLTARVDDVRGIPEVRELASAFNTMTARVEGMLHREKSFTADASHQLRTPLTALRLRLEALEYAIDETGRDDLDAAIGETERLGRLVDGLLAIARAVDGRAEVTVVDLAEIARERMRMWTPLAEERGVQIAYAGPPAPRARAVTGAVDQILDNLLSNALEVSPEGSTITIDVVAGPRSVLLSVRDQGPGMSGDDMARAFDRFFTTGGTGLGLAIVRQLAEASFGEAHVRRAPGGGLEVGVNLHRA